MSRNFNCLLDITVIISAKFGDMTVIALMVVEKPSNFAQALLR